jgi:hypothetical protein
VWCEEGLKALQRQPKRRRLRLNDGSCVRPRSRTIDLLTVITLRFQVLYASMMFGHVRHALRHFTITARPITEE